MDVLQVLFSLWTGNRCTAGLPEAIEKLTAEEQHVRTMNVRHLMLASRQQYSSGISLIIQEES